MTYYTIPYKEDGSCCDGCQPDPSTCACEETECCDFDTMYAGKTLTGTMSSQSIGPGGSGSSTVSIYTAFAYVGGGSFTGGNINNDLTIYGASDDYAGCYDQGPIDSNSNFDTSASAQWYCETDPELFYYPDFLGTSYFLESLVANCGYPTVCVPDGAGGASIVTCSSTYASSCFSISGHHLVCTTYYADETCSTESFQAWGEQTFSFTIA